MYVEWLNDKKDKKIRILPEYLLFGVTAESTLQFICFY
jgi:hypothetical protein